ncbi:hypothetical protein J1N35_034645 [Gossypium stocksii]|uniref:Uncharacterized protein n=1 Tax=Gossypium stocksii TaxID=47602 RepID=A0A9D3USE9_9ROSI|nr:hypothetical protein J1N35_034645 [Gossypium stocksii]
MSVEESAPTPIDIGVGVEVNIIDELNLVLSDSVEEPTHFLTIVVEKTTKGLHNLFYSNAGSSTQDDTLSTIHHLGLTGNDDTIHVHNTTSDCLVTMAF